MAAAQTIMAFDFGTRRIGVATGQTITGHAQALTVLHVKSRADRLAAIAPLVKQWDPHVLVVGRPLHPDGAVHQTTLLAEKFARQIAENFRKPTALVDERYSSVIAASELSQVANKADLDAHAAVVIAEQYLSGMTSATA
jgi:putative holliday junction resolvase